MVRFTLVSYLKLGCVFVKNHAAYGVSVHYFQCILRERLFFSLFMGSGMEQEGKRKEEELI
jgi:hypothetical protein